MRFTRHPLWLVGFRPFFSLAMLAGLSLPLLWVMIFSGRLAGPRLAISPVQWHAHEMFFGFGWAVLGGFLLTSTKNWVNVRGYHGGILVGLTLAWLGERLGMWFQGALPPLLFLVSNNLFLLAIVALLLTTLIRHQESDSYRVDNRFFLLILPLFLVAKALLLSGEHFAAGTSMTLGLFRLAFLVMLERTLSQFMKGGFQVTLLRSPWLDLPIKLLAALLVFAGWLPPLLQMGASGLLALLLLVRFVAWHPAQGLSRIDIGIMYLGYLALTAQLAIAGLAPLLHPAWIGTVSVHVFTVGVMGPIIPAMLIRICNGHTGRKVLFTALDKTVLYLMLGAFLLRVVLPQLRPEAYLAWLHASAGLWAVAFGLLAWRYIPYLIRPRLDGRAH